LHMQLLFLFGCNEARLTALMKNEVAYGYEACLWHIKIQNALCFTQGVSLVLHIGEANASFFIKKS